MPDSPRIEMKMTHSPENYWPKFREKTAITVRSVFRILTADISKIIRSMY